MTRIRFKGSPRTLATCGKQGAVSQLLLGAPLGTSLIYADRAGCQRAWGSSALPAGPELVGSVARTLLYKSLLHGTGERVYLKLCPGVLRLRLELVPHASDDDFSHPYRRRRPKDARTAAALGRGRRLRTVFARRESPADRPRHALADNGRPVDPRPSRGAGDRYLFVHHARSALDFDTVAGAGGLRQGLYARRMERPGRGRCNHNRHDFCAAHEVPDP